MAIYLVIKISRLSTYLAYEFYELVSYHTNLDLILNPQTKNYSQIDADVKLISCSEFIDSTVPAGGTLEPTNLEHVMPGEFSG